MDSRARSTLMVLTLVPGLQPAPPRAYLSLVLRHNGDNAGVNACDILSVFGGLSINTEQLPREWPWSSLGKLIKNATHFQSRVRLHLALCKPHCRFSRVQAMPRHAKLDIPIECQPEAGRKLFDW